MGGGCCKKTKLSLIGPQSGFLGVKGSAYRVPGGQRVGVHVQVPRGSGGRPTRPQGFKG